MTSSRKSASCEAERICEFHFKENGFLLGQGRIDFAAVRKAMYDIGYAGWIQIEGAVPKGKTMMESYTENVRFMRESAGCASDHPGSASLGALLDRRLTARGCRQLFRTHFKSSNPLRDLLRFLELRSEISSLISQAIRPS